MAITDHETSVHGWFANCDGAFLNMPLEYKFFVLFPCILHFALFAKSVQWWSYESPVLQGFSSLNFFSEEKTCLLSEWQNSRLSRPRNSLDLHRHLTSLHFAVSRYLLYSLDQQVMMNHCFRSETSLFVGELSLACFRNISDQRSSMDVLFFVVWNETWTLIEKIKPMDRIKMRLWRLDSQSQALWTDFSCQSIYSENLNFMVIYLWLPLSIIWRLVFYMLWTLPPGKSKRCTSIFDRHCFRSAVWTTVRFIP